MKKIIGLLLGLATLGLVLVQPVAAQAQTTNPTYAYAAVTREGTATYVHGLVKVGQQQARNGNRLVYLQRMINGTWQNMVSRRTLTDGKITVGFVQPASYSYRWYVPPVAYAAAAVSATVTSTSVVPPPAPVYLTREGMYRVGIDMPGWPLLHGGDFRRLLLGAQGGCQRFL